MRSDFGSRPAVFSAPHPLGEIAFEDCRLPADALLGRGRGYALGLATLDRCAAVRRRVRMATRALAEPLAHVEAPQQFGKPLAEFQLVQQKLARMATITAARLLTYRAAYDKDQGQERITGEAAMAKSFATEMAQRTVDDAVQLLGGRARARRSSRGPSVPCGACPSDLRGDDGDPAADHCGGTAQIGCSSCSA